MAKRVADQESKKGMAANDLKIKASLAVKGSEEDEEGAQSGAAEQDSQKGEASSELKSKFFSSDAMLQSVLLHLSSDKLRNFVKRAASIVKGRRMLPDVVQELHHIIKSPTEASCSSTVLSRLLVWGVPGHDKFIGDSDAAAYARYASPYVAAVVLEENSKITTVSYHPRKVSLVLCCVVRRAICEILPEQLVTRSIILPTFTPISANLPSVYRLASRARQT